MSGSRAGLMGMVVFLVGVTALSPPSLTASAAKKAAVVLARLTFWSAKGPTCGGWGSTRTSFPATTAYICVGASFSRWTGRHEASLIAYSPGGVYGSATHTQTGKGGGVNWGVSIQIAGTPAASMVGKWTARLQVDGHPLKSAPFTLTKPASPRPTGTAKPKPSPTPTTPATSPTGAPIATGTRTPAGRMVDR